MSCCDDIILRMRADIAPGAFTAELSNGRLVSFDRAYLDHAGRDTVESLQAGLLPRGMMDDWGLLWAARRDADGWPVLTWPPRGGTRPASM